MDMVFSERHRLHTSDQWSLSWVSSVFDRPLGNPDAFFVVRILRDHFPSV